MCADPGAVVERAMVAIRRRQSRRTLARLDPAAAGAGAEHTRVLDVVEERQEADLPCTVSTVADWLAVDRPRASRQVAGAVRAGLVRRDADQADGRRSLLTLTTAGRAHLAHVHRFRRSMAERAMATWPSHDRQEFARLLHDFVRQLEELGPSDVEQDRH